MGFESAEQELINRLLVAICYSWLLPGDMVHCKLIFKLHSELDSVLPVLNMLIVRNIIVNFIFEINNLILNTKNEMASELYNYFKLNLLK